MDALEDRQIVKFFAQKVARRTFVFLVICLLTGAIGSMRQGPLAPSLASGAEPKPSKPAAKPDRAEKAETDAPAPAGGKGKKPVSRSDEAREFQRYASAIRQRPWDEQTILDFADWLQTTDEARARLVRVQLELGQLPAGDPQWQALSTEVRQLTKDHKARWTKPLATLADKAEIELAVGLIDEVELNDATDADLALLASTPELRELRLTAPKLTAAGFKSLTGLPNLDSLTIQDGPKIGEQELAELEKLSPWTVVRLYVDEQDAAAVRAMNEKRAARFEKLSADEQHNTAVRFLRHGRRTVRMGGRKPERT